jgi:hypothetical protein
MSAPMNRRQAALAAAALGAVAASPEKVAAQAARPLNWTPRGLTPAQAQVLDVIAELIIPATDTPGAREAGVPKFVDQAVADYCTPAEAQAIRAGLDRAEADARSMYQAGFVALSYEQQANLLRRYDAEGRAAPTVATTPPPTIGRGDTETGLANQPAPTPRPPPPRAFFAILKELVTVAYFTSELGATKAVRWDPNPGAYKGCVPLAEIGRAWAI